MLDSNTTERALAGVIKMPPEIPEVVIERLPTYARALSRLARQGQEVVSSQDLGDLLGVTPAQIRKDLSYFGRFGKQGRGYNVRRLLEELRQILGLDRQWTMALVGVGHLGKAILHYGGFAPQGFHIVAAFDNDPATVGQAVGELTVQCVDDLREALIARPVDIGIVAVPAEQAQAGLVIRQGRAQAHDKWVYLPGGSASRPPVASQTLTVPSRHPAARRWPAGCTGSLVGSPCG